jgi:integrase
MALDIDGFSRHMDSKSELTKDAYVSTVRRFNEFLNGRYITKENIIEFAFFLEKKGCNHSSLNRHMAAIVAYLSFIELEIKVQTFSVKEHLPEYLDEEKQEALITACQTKLEKAIVMLLLKSGIRRAELLDVSREHLTKPKDKSFYIRIMGKEGRERVVKVPEYVYPIIQDWITQLPQDWTKLFPYHSSSINRIIRDVGERAGIKELHPHTLRHSYATLYMKKSGNSQRALTDLQHQLGHRNIQTTMKYVHVNPQDIVLPDI